MLNPKLPPLNAHTNSSEHSCVSSALFLSKDNLKTCEASLFQYCQKLSDAMSAAPDGPGSRRVPEVIRTLDTRQRRECLLAIMRRVHRIGKQHHITDVKVLNSLTLDIAREQVLSIACARDDDDAETKAASAREMSTNNSTADLHYMHTTHTAHTTHSASENPSTSSPTASTSHIQHVDAPLDSSHPNSTSVNPGGYSSAGVFESGMNVVIQNPLSRASSVANHTIDKFIALSGADRDWLTLAQRYEFPVEIAGFTPGCIQSNLRNVTSFSISCVILPMDVSPCAPSFNYPYLLLHIDGFNVYDGTNDVMRGAFSVMRFDSSYTSAGGRGFIILVPAQREAMHWNPPLPSLQNLRLSLRRPNGMLFSDARDEHVLARLEYDATRESSLKIVTKKYFSVHEFSGGDTVVFKDCRAVLSPRLMAQDAPAKTRALEKLASFMNREQGHDVQSIGAANNLSSLFYQTFFIAPSGSMDASLGQTILDVDILNIVQLLASDTSGESYVQGRILNTTLQMAITCRVCHMRQSLGS
jgi:hypothetical protein